MGVALAVVVIPSLLLMTAVLPRMLSFTATGISTEMSRPSIDEFDEAYMKTINVRVAGLQHSPVVDASDALQQGDVRSGVPREQYIGFHAAYSSYILPLTLACYRLGQSWDSDLVAEDHHMFYKCYFAAVWNSLDVPAPDDFISAINPKMALRPMILPARFQPAWRHSQGVAELGYVLLPAPTWASEASPSRCSSSASSTLYSRFLSWSWCR